MLFLRSELLFILCFFPLFGFPFALFHTKECNYRSNFVGLFSPSAGKRQTAHVLCHKVDVQGTPEVFVKVTFDFGTFDENILSLIVFDVCVPQNICTSAFILVLVNAFLVGAEGYAEFFSFTCLLSSSSNFLTISSTSPLNSVGAFISSVALLIECSSPSSPA